MQNDMEKFAVKWFVDFVDATKGKGLSLADYQVALDFMYRVIGEEPPVIKNVESRIK